MVSLTLVTFSPKRSHQKSNSKIHQDKGFYQYMGCHIYGAPLEVTGVFILFED